MNKGAPQNNEIAVLIPAYNEEKSIGELVRKLKENFSTVLVIDDGSTDNTSSHADKKGAIILKHNKCQGKGAALQTGFRYIIENNFPAVITIDGDGQHPVEDIKGFVSAFKRNPKIGIWVGKRKVVSTDMPFLRRLTNLSMSLLISFFSGQYIPDTQCGFRLIKKEVLEKVTLFTTHFETESEILIKAGWKGFNIRSVPISTVYKDEKSKIRPTTDTTRFFKMLVFLFCPFLQKTKN